MELTFGVSMSGGRGGEVGGNKNLVIGGVYRGDFSRWQGQHEQIFGWSGRGPACFLFLCSPPHCHATLLMSLVFLRGLLSQGDALDFTDII